MQHARSTVKWCDEPLIKELPLARYPKFYLKSQADLGRVLSRMHIPHQRTQL